MNILEMDLGPLVPHHSIEIIVGIILLLLLTWLIAKAVVPRFEKLYEERTETIQGGIERAEKAQAEAKAALEKYQAQLANARDEAATLAGRIVGESLQDDQRVQATVDRFLSSLAEEPSASDSRTVNRA